jgi:hypothetical protein
MSVQQAIDSASFQGSAMLRSIAVREHSMYKSRGWRAFAREHFGASISLALNCTAFA